MLLPPTIPAPAEIGLATCPHEQVDRSIFIWNQLEGDGK
jgi:hypothetical protein